MHATTTAEIKEHTQEITQNSTPTNDEKKQIVASVKEAIKDRQLESKKMRRVANTLSGLAKHEAHRERGRYGMTTRSYLLLYAMLRGKSYRRTEPLPVNPQKQAAQLADQRNWLESWVWSASLEFAGQNEKLALALTGDVIDIAKWFAQA